jgi:hypothetical protein
MKITHNYVQIWGGGVAVELVLEDDVYLFIFVFSSLRHMFLLTPRIFCDQRRAF